MNPLPGIAAWSNGHPFLAGGIVLAVAFGLGWGFSIADNADITELFVDPDMPAKQAFDEVQERFDLGDQSSIVWLDPDPLSPRILQEQLALAAELRTHEFVLRAEGLAEAVEALVGDLGTATDQEIRDTAAQFLQERPDLAERLVRPDALQLPISLVVNADAHTSVGAIQDAIDEHATGEVIAGGYPFAIIVYDESGAADVQLLLPLAIGIIVLILALLFRRPGDVIIPLVTVFMAILMTYGVMPLFGVPFSPLMFSVMPLIMGLGIDYMLHIVYEYREEDPSLPSEERFRRTAKLVGAPVFYTALTTAIGFGSFLVSPIPQVRYWGALIGTGALFSFILGFVMLPMMYRMTRRPKRRPTIGQGLERGLGRFADLVLSHRAIALAALLLVTGGLAVSSSQLDVERTLDVDLDDDHPYMQDFNRIRDFFGGQVNGLVYLRDGLATSRDDLIALEQALQAIPGMGTVNGPTIRMTQLFGTVPSGQDYLDALASPPLADLVRGDAAIIPFAYSFDDEIPIINAVLDLVDESALNDIATGQGAIQRQSQGDVLDSLIYSTIVAAVLIFILLFVVLRRPLDAMITFLPLVFVVVWQFGVQAVFNIPLNAVTGVTTAMVLGVGVDYALHLMARFRIARQEGMDAHAASKDAIVHVGKPVVAGSVTTAAAFFVLGFSKSTQLSQFGIVAGIVVLSAFAVSLVLMPILTSLRVNVDYRAPGPRPRRSQASAVDVAATVGMEAETPGRARYEPRYAPDVGAIERAVDDLSPRR